MWKAEKTAFQDAAGCAKTDRRIPGEGVKNETKNI